MRAGLTKPSGFGTAAVATRVRRSYSFSFETEEMWAFRISLRTEKKFKRILFNSIYSFSLERGENVSVFRMSLRTEKSVGETGAP